MCRYIWKLCQKLNHKNSLRHQHHNAVIFRFPISKPQRWSVVKSLVSWRYGKKIMIDEYANRRKFCVSIFAFSAPAVKATERSTWLSKTWASLCIRDCKCRCHVLLWLSRYRPWVPHSDSKVFMFWIAVVCFVQSIQIPWNFPSEEQRTINPSDLCTLAKVSDSSMF